MYGRRRRLRSVTAPPALDVIEGTLAKLRCLGGTSPARLPLSYGASYAPGFFYTALPPSVCAAATAAIRL